MKIIIKKIIISTLLSFGTLAHADLTVLLYHRIDNVNKYGISEENFTQQMDYLLDNQYVFITNQELLEMLNKDFDFTKNKYVMITFDDGWKTQIKAAEIMSKRNIPAIFFVNGEPIEKKWPAYLSKLDLLEIEKNKNFLIADHSFSHKLNILHDPEKLILDFNKNVDFLIKNTKRPSFVYAYPYGAKQKDYLNYLKSKNVPLIYGTGGIKIKNSKQISKYDIPRFTITNRVDFSLFKYYVK